VTKSYSPAPLCPVHSILLAPDASVLTTDTGGESETLIGVKGPGAAQVGENTDSTGHNQVALTR
jgi:hypothetical protein